MKLSKGFNWSRLLMVFAVLAAVAAFPAGRAEAATTTIRPDGVVSNAGAWTGVTAANLNDSYNFV